MNRIYEFEVNLVLADRNSGNSKKSKKTGAREMVHSRTYLGAAKEVFDNFPNVQNYVLVGATVRQTKNEKFRIYQGPQWTRVSMTAFMGRARRPKKVTRTLIGQLQRNGESRYLILRQIRDERNTIVVSDSMDELIVTSYELKIMDTERRYKTICPQTFGTFDPSINTHEVFIKCKEFTINSMNLCDDISHLIERAKKSQGRWSFYPDVITTMPDDPIQTDEDFVELHNRMRTGFYFYFERESDAMMFKLGAPSTV
jgi:hypothetical protein